MEGEAVTALTRLAWSGIQFGGVKSAVKQVMSPELHERTRNFNRVRWITKYRLTRRYRTEIGLAGRLAYVLFDPELESYSFELDDEHEVIASLAVALGRPEEELVAYAAEIPGDPELNKRLSRHVRWRANIKRRMPLGSRLAWYVAVRALKPELVLETGIYIGLGSLALLRALARNRQEGHPGELISFDLNPRAGSIVREELRADWQRVLGLTSDTLLHTIDGRRVGMLFQDTVHNEENQLLEFGAALAHAAPQLLLVDCSGGQLPTLERLCDERGGSYHCVLLRSREHIHPGTEFRFGLFTDPEPR